MAKFGKRSLENLKTCDPRLQQICYQAIKEIDFAVLCGHRNEEDQNRAYFHGKSQLRFPQSKHNKFPSAAVDLAPYPIDWNNIKRFIQLKNIIFRHAQILGIDLVWGGDWETLKDYPHYELKEWQYLLAS